MTNHNINRRELIGMGGALGISVAFGAGIPAIGHAAGARDPRFITLLLRGGLDGLSAAPPLFDPDYQRLRGNLGVDADHCIPIAGGFGLHPSLVHLSRQYKAGNAAVVHACATPYRDRSHFDGQDVLESGGAGVGRADTGWLNRMLCSLKIEQSTTTKGLAIGPVTPLILRGQADVLGWSPTPLNAPDPELAARVLGIYEHTDKVLAATLRASMETSKIVANVGHTPSSTGGEDPNVAIAAGAARLLASSDGPRIAALSFEGWDTHAGEKERITNLLTSLDNVLNAFEDGLGGAWRDTVILVATEFGRTAAVNGTDGTDHGTATTALLTGGAVKGGRVIAEWPGLKNSQLYEGRDLAPTLDLRAVAKGIMTGLYDMTSLSMSKFVFPDSSSILPMPDLIV
ncbi:hypothetical protein MMA231_03442 (plasmid) [Asticcacaulis sp. MM231]|uniref:DUF1501 domain-containing protein n=1 Tax=Asticcacaulis sp. MM231 TaxID=3157666 RepID=UPI0032D59DD9